MVKVKADVRISSRVMVISRKVSVIYTYMYIESIFSSYIYLFIYLEPRRGSTGFTRRGAEESKHKENKKLIIDASYTVVQVHKYKKRNGSHQIYFIYHSWKLVAVVKWPKKTHSG